ncbi:MAG: HD domain-containing protein [Chitinispirillales bacterium]|jgi:HD-GYP domain-containing protein (c-di-GMP phosphodiesterase class II)|nr:HD domain-containing protein [Chitinispirillales bacterium]
MTEKITNYESIVSLKSEWNKIQDLDLLLERILYEARRMVNADAGSIYVKQKSIKDGEQVDELLIKYAQNDTLAKSGPDGERVRYSVLANSEVTVPISVKSISGYCATTRNIVNIKDVYDIPATEPYSFNTSIDKLTGYKSSSMLTFPLIAADRLLGVIQLINAMDSERNIVPFSSNDEALITHFAADATTVLQRANENRAMILRMMRMSELRDPKETGTHVNRVAGYAVEIYDRWALKHNVPENEWVKTRDCLRIGAMLHDIGKVAISDTILKKPGRFTPEEFKIMQQHSLYGATLFDDPQSPIDIMAQQIALTHHENWDGTGYPGWIDPTTGKVIKADEKGEPLGKKGEEIPLAGRIVAIADVYDALRSRRVYKDPFGEDVALAEMRKLSGIKFDPQLVDIFFEILPNIEQAQKRYPEQDDG